MISVYFAPMEGLTDAVFRRVHCECFPGVACYYMPFITPTQNMILTGREKRNVLPEYNAGVPCVPQVLTRNPAHFLWAAGVLADLGYPSVNLNAGCPSATVTSKGKGAGLLRDPEALDCFLDEICAHSPVPVSVKTRIGLSDPKEWADLLAVYAGYPLQMLIVHPRTGRERYDPGTIHRDCWQAACEGFPGPLVYNGDLVSDTDVHSLLQSASRTVDVMLGRGLAANPALARIINGGVELEKGELVRFHDRLVEEYQAIYPPNVTFTKLRDVMKLLACCFENAEKLKKQMCKSRSLSHLLDIDRQLFASCTLRNKPTYIHEKPHHV